MSNILNQRILDELRMVMEDDFPVLMDTFLTESARQFEDVQRAWQGQDFDALRRNAHSLKGSCGNVGADALQQTCAQLEFSARDEDGAAIDDLVAAVSTQLQQVCEAVRAL